VRAGLCANQNKTKVMNDKFDELAKGMAQSITRRGALKRFSLGFIGVALAALGLANKAQAKPYRCQCSKFSYGCERYGYGSYYDCLSFCEGNCSKNNKGP
jgi:hypothetical protein